MRTLLLLRHGTADASATYGHDHDCPLSERGRRSAADVGNWLRLTDEMPDVVVCSTAARARETADLAMQAGQWDCPVLLDERIYTSDSRYLCNLVRTFDENAARVLVCGHEPGIVTALSFLVGRASVRFPPATIARIHLQIERWEQTRPGLGTLVWFVPPRLIESSGRDQKAAEPGGVATGRTHAS